MHGVQIFQNGPIVWHILVVDDRFLFCNVSNVEDENMKEI